MAKHNELGKKGELIARKFLEAKGFKILETNWRHEKDELDIIVKDDDELVIIEVKTRSTDYFGDPSEAVGKAKEEFIIRAAEAYIEIHDLNMDIRFDIISIITNSNEEIIEHIKDAFYPELPE